MRDLLSLRIDEITFKDVQDFCAQQTPENIRLDYKRGWSSNEPAKKIAKEVAAFANTQGGTILYGVEEGDEKKRLPVMSPQGTELGADPRHTIQSACTHAVFPPIVPEVSDFIRNPTDEKKGFVIVRVGASEDIHTVDAGKGIYIRANDLSEPVQASLDRIEWMLQRRGRAASLQAERRARILRTLQGISSPIMRPGILEVSIGPKIVVDPLIDHARLRERAGESCVQTHYPSQESVPIAELYRASGMTDGIYCHNGRTEFLRESAGAIDVFGNTVVRSALLQPQNYDEFETPVEKPGHLPRIDQQAAGVEAAAAVERILCVVRAAHQFYSGTGFVGVVELAVSAPSASGCPLTWHDGHRFHVIGICAPGNEVAVQSLFSTTDLAGDHSVILSDFVLRLLWSWGCTKPDAPKKVIDRAEQYHYGRKMCTCGLWHHPTNRDACLECRSKP